MRDLAISAETVVFSMRFNVSSTAEWDFPMYLNTSDAVSRLATLVLMKTSA